MRALLIVSCLVVLSCATEPEKVTVTALSTDTVQATPSNTPTDSDFSFIEEPDTAPPVIPVTKKPTGVYRFLLPQADGKKLLHTIAFYPGTFRLQEEYKKDSVVVTEGTWSPSQGFIWLYKDQVVRGRYTWQGDTLQYYSPRSKETYPMNQLTPVWTNEVWQTKKAQEDILYGVGTEPFWSVEITKEDTVVVNRPDWSIPVRLKISGITSAADSTVFSAVDDSLRVTVYPLFCSDGMSDFLYTRKIKLVYKGQSYKGCGEFLQGSH